MKTDTNTKNEKPSLTQDGGGSNSSDLLGSCGLCGGEMSKNPHPNAGKPEHLLEVGACYECIPCLYGRSIKRQNKLLDISNILSA